MGRSGNIFRLVIVSIIRRWGGGDMVWMTKQPDFSLF